MRDNMLLNWYGMLQRCLHFIEYKCQLRGMRKYVSLWFELHQSHVSMCQWTANVQWSLLHYWPDMLWGDMYRFKWRRK